jgi:hypothetical protein
MVSVTIMSRGIAIMTPVARLTTDERDRVATTWPSRPASAASKRLPLVSARARSPSPVNHSAVSSPWGRDLPHT